MKKKSIPYAVAFLLILVILIKNLINHSFTQLLADHCRNTNCSFCYFHAFFFVRISEYENEVATFAAASFFLMLTVLTIILQRMSICNPMKRLPHGERYL